MGKQINKKIVKKIPQEDFSRRGGAAFQRSFSQEKREKEACADEPLWWNWQTLVAANSALSRSPVGNRKCAPLWCGGSARRTRLATGAAVAVQFTAHRAVEQNCTAPPFPIKSTSFFAGAYYFKSLAL